MAQTGYTPIQIYRSSTASAAPTSGNLVAGELAINTADGKLFYLDNLNAVQVIGWKLVPVTAGGTGTTTSTGTGSVVLSDSPTFTTKITTPSVTATTTDLTLSAISTGAVKFSTAGGLQAQVIDVTGSNRYLQLQGGVSGSSSPAVGAIGGSNLDVYSSGGSTINFWTNGATNTRAVAFTHTASAVNYVQVTGGATGNGVAISAQGSDSNVSFIYRTKGIFNHVFQTGASTTTFAINQTNGSANYNETASSATGFATTFKALGSDTNISMAFQPKGTGAIDLAAGSSGVNISNGGTVTAITRTAFGGGYTSLPSVVVSAPTTAGGVQATASCTLAISGAVITSGGTGYTVNDVLTFVGGTGTAGTATVTAVSAGVITAATYTNGNYSVVPSSPTTVTGGTGTGASFTLTWAVSTPINILTAGSGYIEQPTVTFSGGGGSGASAYATVGSATTFKTLSSTLSLTTPAGEQLRVSDSGNATSDYVQISGGANPFIATGGASANSNLSISSRGTGSISFRTNGVNQVQMQVTHTASAVNYVQVTGAPTGGQVTISAQGSDTNIPLQFNSKGNQAFNFYTNGGTQRQFRIVHTGSSVNFGYVAGSATGTAVVFGVDALSSDTNINLALSPKGTGTVQFGTYTAGVLTPTGYITITDSGGTTRRLLVG